MRLTSLSRRKPWRHAHSRNPPPMPTSRTESTTIPVGHSIAAGRPASTASRCMRSRRDSRAPNRPAVLLIHGFPELGYSWRHVMLPLAKAGYHVIAPDQRGYGRSGGTDVKFDDDLTPFSTLNRVRDMMSLINALGHRNVAMVVGHDFGSPVAGWCALTRPDVFRSVVMMSAPFGGGGVATVQHVRLARENRASYGGRAAPHLQRARMQTRSSRSCRHRASTIRPTTRRARPTRTCGIRRRAFTTSCAPTTT